MVGVLIRMKLAVLRNSTTGGRAAWMVTGGVLGLCCAAATVLLTFADVSHPGVLGDLLAAVWLGWALSWMIGPLWGASAVLRAEHFALLPLPRPRLAAGLLGAGLVAITTAVTAVAFLSLITYAARLGPAAALVAVPAAAGVLVLVVLLSRVTHALFTVVATSRTGAAVTGLLFAGLLIVSQSGWMLIVPILYSDVLTTGFSPLFSTVLRAVPSSWGVVAVEAAGRGDWPVTAAALAGLPVLGALLLLVWAATLGTPRRSRVTIRGGAYGTAPARGPLAGPAGAVFRKEVRTWWRDPGRITAAVVPIAWALGTALLPLTFGAPVLLPWAGAAVAWFAVTSAGNLYGDDGTALWHTLTTGSERADVRGRQWAYLAVYGPVAVLLSAGLTVWSGYTWAWPWVVAVVPALLGGGAGLIAYASVSALTPGPDPRRRADAPLEGADATGPSYVLFWVGILPAGPPLAVIVTGHLLDVPWLLWAGLPVGVATGVALAWWLGDRAAARLQERGPEMLHTMRTGRPPPPSSVGVARSPLGVARSPLDVASSPAGVAPSPSPAAVVASGREVVRVLGCWIGGGLLTFPQGLVPVILILVGADVRSWFLAMYLPPPWGLVLGVAGVVAGVALFTTAIRATFRRAVDGR
ncbi:hypothetical protein [Actinoplanes sp. DH11]|uniref:hypothetical protein n=1 Tax=Actinoplanes sp. DH11 TaxID=2857011 RepID=UPI001E58FA78|nr:hypothetical protein [Actinoplanes sp. DH11]